MQDSDRIDEKGAWAEDFQVEISDLDRVDYVGQGVNARFARFSLAWQRLEKRRRNQVSSGLLVLLALTLIAALFNSGTGFSALLAARLFPASIQHTVAAPRSTAQLLTPQKDGIGCPVTA